MIPPHLAALIPANVLAAEPCVAIIAGVGAVASITVPPPPEPEPPARLVENTPPRLLRIELASDAESPSFVT